MTNDQSSMIKPKRPFLTARPNPKQMPLELYQVIIHCRDEDQQRELYDRLRCEGLRCRLTVL
ncbi:MAG: hypothetical protein WD894_05380 [Pirellulales bacterium]